MLLLLVSAPTAWTATGGVACANHACLRAGTPVAQFPTMEEEAAKAAWLARTAPDWAPPGGFAGTVVPTAAPTDFTHVPISFFALDQLGAKGSRASQGSLVDVGDPHDFSRPISKESWCGARVGSWACTPGGWDSPKLRPTTETFLVLDGEGCVHDVDGAAHPFGPGDVVVLPKHWSGRWDITQQIHKIWVVHDHADVEGYTTANGVVRAVVAPLPSAASSMGASQPVVTSAQGLHQAPAHVAQTVYNVGPTRVGFLNCAPGSFHVDPRPAAEVFFVADGLFFLTNPDGSARRCVAGDTVVLPQGWSGEWHVVEPVRKVWVQVE